MLINGLNVVAEADLIVAGGGVGGFLAATAAARSGIKTLVIERSGYFGGSANTGLVGTIWSIMFGNEQVVKGLPGEFIDRLIERGGAKEFTEFVVAALQPEYTTKFLTLPYNSEIYKIVADEMVVEAGADIMFHTDITEVLMEGRSVKGLVIQNADGQGIVLGKMFLDCTGNADVAYYAGAEVLPAETEELQPMTACFKMSNIDFEAYDTMTIEFRREMAEKGVAEGMLPRIAFGGFKTHNPGEMVFNVVRIPGLDGTKAKDLTFAELEGRRQINKILQYYKQYAKGFENAYITAMGPVIGVRETRRIRCMDILSGDKTLAGDQPETSICLGTGPQDAHQRGNGFTFMKMPDRPFGIPYGTMVPLGIDNLFVTGRNISAERAANAAMRHMGTCMAIGHAAGVAASMCLKKGICPADLDVQELRAELRRQGAVLET